MRQGLGGGGENEYEQKYISFPEMLFCIFSNVLVYFSIQSNESLSRVQLFATPWTVAHQAPTSMGFSRQEY